MRFFVILGLLVCAGVRLSALSKEDFSLVDGGVVSVNGSVLLRSDFTEPQILKGGVAYGTQELIDVTLIEQKALEYGMNASPLEIQSRVNAMKEDNNQLGKTEAEWNTWLKTSGLSSDRLNRQLRRGITVPRLKEAMLPSKETVSDKIIAGYCEKNPEYEECYDLAIAFLDSKEADLSTYNWIAVDKVNKNELRDDMLIVENMAEGQISEPFKNNDQYQVVKVIKHYEPRLKTLAERKDEVTRLLFSTETVKREKKFVEQVSHDAVITYLPGFQYELKGA